MLNLEIHPLTKVRATVSVDLSAIGMISDQSVKKLLQVNWLIEEVVP